MTQKKKKKTTVLATTGGGSLLAIAIFIGHAAGYLWEAEPGIAHGIEAATKELSILRDGGPTDKDVAEAACAVVAQYESGKPGTNQIKSSILQQLGFGPEDIVPYYVSGPVQKATTALSLASQDGPLAGEYAKLCLR